MKLLQYRKTLSTGMLAIVTLAASAVLFAAPGDLVLPRKGGDGSAEITAPSIFQHWVHRINYRCDACHDKLFKMELGATEISMDMMNEGGSCATCHDGSTAFSVNFQNCHRCHRVPESDK